MKDRFQDKEFRIPVANCCESEQNLNELWSMFMLILKLLEVKLKTKQKARQIPSCRIKSQEGNCCKV